MSAGSLTDIRAVVTGGRGSAVAMGSMAVLQAKDMGVLISFPTLEELENTGEP